MVLDTTLPASSGWAGLGQEEERILGLHQRDGRSPDGGRIAGLGHCQINAGQHVHTQHEVVGPVSHQPRKLAQDAFLLSKCSEAQLLPLVAVGNGRERFHEQRGPAGGHVVNYALNVLAHLRLHQDHHSTLALGDESLLQDATGI